MKMAWWIAVLALLALFPSTQPLHTTILLALPL
jgi:hypothetical protein